MKRLILEHQGNEYISAPFNMLCYRAVRACLENPLAGDPLAVLDYAGEVGAIALFDGILPPEVITELDAEGKITAISQVIDWYSRVRPPKNENKDIQIVGDPGDFIIHIYNAMLEKGIPPDVTDRQDPQLLFDSLCYRGAQTVDMNELSPDERIFMGY